MDKVNKEDLLQLFEACCKLRAAPQYASEREANLRFLLRVKARYPDVDVALFDVIDESIFSWHDDVIVYVCGRFVDDLFVFGKYIGISREELYSRYEWNFANRKQRQRREYENFATQQRQPEVWCCLL